MGSKLSELKNYETAEIVEVSLDSIPVVNRLADLGLQKGQTVTRVPGSPWGGVHSFQLSNGTFALEDWICRNVTIKKEVNK